MSVVPSFVTQFETLFEKVQEFLASKESNAKVKCPFCNKGELNLSIIKSIESVPHTVKASCESCKSIHTINVHKLA